MIVAVLGGSFDPFHRGHLALVEALRGRGLADLVLVVPAARSPHKGPPVATADHRLRMAELAVAGRPGVRVDPLEVERGGCSYTVATLEELAARRPADRLRLAIGADSLAGLAAWRRPRRILELAELVVFARDGGPPALPAELADLADRVLAVPDFAVGVSSSEARRALAEGRPADRLIPEAVLAYIARHGLYRGGPDAAPERTSPPCP